MMVNFPKMRIHDLRLPDWGPYTKKYIGISHVADADRGWRFDLSVAPGFYRRKIDLPNGLWESGYHPWEASPGLDYFCHRHELEWKDRVYCDIAFAGEEASGRLIRCECVNETDAPQTVVLHLLASLEFPAGNRSRASLPPGAVWVNALDYLSFEYGERRPADGLASDLLMRGEVRGEGFVSGSGLGLGRTPGDGAAFEYACAGAFQNAMLLLRCRAAAHAAVRLRFDGGEGHTVEFQPTGGEFALVPVSLGPVGAGSHRLEAVALEGGLVEWDGFVLVEAAQAAAVRFEPEKRDPRPEQLPGPRPNTLFLKYSGLEHGYGIAWGGGHFTIREFLGDDLDCLMRHRVHDHVSSVLRGQGAGHHTDVFLYPIALAPHSREIIEGYVCQGTREEVMARLETVDLKGAEAARAFKTGRARASLPSSTPAGKAFEFSQARMAATTLLNVVYPARARRSFIKHNTPGRWWDSLYTWDSGFIGLGLLELDVDRAVDCLGAYLTEPDDPHAAFVHHGSPVPVQHYLYQELWNRTGSRELLRRFYPGLRQYHRFLAGRDPRSSTRRLKSGLLQTWDYFYNSGGWDDYPPQCHVHAQHLEALVATASNTAHCIRAAKILRAAALELGEEADAAEYAEDIATLGAALQLHAWDDPSGYFGYVAHDARGNPMGILRHESGANFNMGLDGVSPLVAGVCTPGQRRRLLAALGSSQALMTPIGLSTVDQSAPYYREDGYWNGAVWMPHQWFIWKTLLDLGEADLAFHVAQTALTLWANETGLSYHCFEHFIIKTGRGAGWHQFGGLSTPVLSWFAAYYVPGRLTGGLDLWVRRREITPDHTELQATLAFDAARIAQGGPVTLVAVMNPAFHYEAAWRGEAIPVRERSPGTLELVFAPGASKGDLTISKIA